MEVDIEESGWEDIFGRYCGGHKATKFIECLGGQRH